ncbi:ganglioside GM2 activator-like [Mytilus galloprovincialis]|uniref:ganglioside GM2 activator-like n=1 Tax=Mytilus galloprovincialis TaxID=29158 RepID=UPI003F7B64CA
MEKICCILIMMVIGCLASELVYTDCNKNQHVLHVNSASLSPYPPKVPGNLTVSGQLELGKNISGNIKLDVSIHKKELFLWIRVPCVSGVGSCTYDFCSLLTSNFVSNGKVSCPSEMKAQNLSCICPIQAGKYTLKPVVIQIPKMSGIVSDLMSGKYKVDAKLVNKDTGEQLGCYHVEITLDHSCSGFGCIFG